MKKEEVIAIAAGGTGGHIFPAISLEDEFKKRKIKAIFLTDYKFDKFIFRKDLEKFCIKAASPAGGWKGKLKTVIFNSIGFLQARSVLKKHKVTKLIAFGGYCSFPVILAAISLKIPFYLHEQNSYMGKVNRLFIHKCQKVVCGFKNTIGYNKLYNNKILYLGNPVREEFFAKLPINYLNDNLFNIFITGGSQGAKILSSIIPKIIIRLKEKTDKEIIVTQQCRVEDIEYVKKQYVKSDIKHEISAFFNDMPQKLSKADLVISRSGASSIAEIAVLGKASILIPFKFASNNHQYFNAKTLSDQNAAILLEENDKLEENLFINILELLNNRNKLTMIGLQAKNFAFDDANIKLANLLISASK